MQITNASVKGLFEIKTYFVGEVIEGKKVTTISIDCDTNPVALQIYLDKNLWKEYYGVPFEVEWANLDKK